MWEKMAKDWPESSGIRKFIPTEKGTQDVIISKEIVWAICLMPASRFSDAIQRTLGSQQL